ncbi:hypothetical protein J7L48_09565 [bacterium]|nr:hypothetical protein [bacterium]
MKKFVTTAILLALILWGISCNEPNKKEIKQIRGNKGILQTKDTQAKEEKFKYSTDDLKNIFPKIEKFQLLSEGMKNIRKKDFSVNMYEVNYSTMIIENEGVENSEILNIKILDIGDNMLYPPLVAHNVFYKFGIKTDSDLIFQDKEKYEDWKLVYNYDKIKKKGNASALKNNLFIIMNSENIDIESVKEIFKKDILQKIKNK